MTFKQLKEKLTNQLVLSHFNNDLKTILVTDGSKKRLAIILQQNNKDNEIRAISYASKKRNCAQIIIQH